MHLRLDELTKINEPLIGVLLDYQKDLLVIRNPETGVYCGLLPPQTGAALMLLRDKHQAIQKGQTRNARTPCAGLRHEGCGRCNRWCP